MKVGSINLLLVPMEIKPLSTICCYAEQNVQMQKDND